MTPEEKRIRELQLELELAEAEEAEAAQASGPSIPQEPKHALPDLGGLNAIRSQFANGLAKGGFDEGVGALFSRKDLMPGAHLRMPNGTMVPINSNGDAYRASRDFLRQEQKSAAEHHPWLGGAALMGGEMLSDVALGGAKAAGRTYQTLAGLSREIGRAHV